ncbi:MAG: ROK family protein [Oscillospiraceae bacterium]|nr:ROK family protein [Oscillospiraceae bacterium]
MKIKPVLDSEFKPSVLYNREFLREASLPVSIAIQRENGLTHRVDTKLTTSPAKNRFYLERLVKTLLWSVGGYRVMLSPGGAGDHVQGDIDIVDIYRDAFDHIRLCYAPDGLRSFDSAFMSRIYENPFSVESLSPNEMPAARANPVSIGRHLDGRRIGFDAGGSDMKVSAVVDGRVVFSQEIVWHPKVNHDPEYHYAHIKEAIDIAREKLGQVDAIGVSSAGVYVDNRAMAASLFIKIPPDKFNARIKDIYKNIAGDIPLVVCNDGDVAALAGSMHKNSNAVLGIAMGTSEAAGYVDKNGRITGWLNELAFVPVDFQPEAPVDEWSGDIGCGVKYFSQDAVIRLAPRAGISLDSGLTPAEKLKVVQTHLADGHAGAIQIFETIGVWFGYALASYAELYEIELIQILGRVTSGKAGDIILDKATQVLKAEFPEYADRMTLYIPDEYERRVGQSIAAASLPEFK